ncbi:MAG: hypothetical protein LBR56_05655 [Sporomusaceae bacterium]|jgi:hypothetical protein|nr:hypothetical protein [Sporomusaceae bacterium]
MSRRKRSLLEEGVEEIGEKKIGFFEFKNPSLDQTIFNLMFFTVGEKDLIHGVFNCTFEEHEPWVAAHSQADHEFCEDQKQPIIPTLRR